MSDKIENEASNKGRRKVLQKAGVAGGLAAAAVWSKPSLNSVILPAHAQTSDLTPMAMVLAGGTASTRIASLQSTQSDSIAKRALNVLVPEASADVAPADNCGAFTQNGLDDYSHCIQLDFEAAAPGSDFTLNLSGPTLYYNSPFYNSSYTYYCGSKNLSGSTEGTLEGQSFTVVLGDFEFVGEVAEDFNSAFGKVTQINGFGFNLGSDYTAGTRAFCFPGYSAYWAVNGSGECAPGAGAYSAPGHGIQVQPIACA